MYDALMTRLNYWLNLDANGKIKILLERQEMIMKKKEDVENAEKKRVHGSFASLWVRPLEENKIAPTFTSSHQYFTRFRTANVYCTYFVEIVICFCIYLTGATQWLDITRAVVMRHWTWLGICTLIELWYGLAVQSNIVR